MNEFDLIAHYFKHQPVDRPDVALGIGDDAAVLNVPPGQQLVVSTDMLVSGVHFPEGTAARAVGHKALAVNLSDLAAMGAEPAWFTLSLSLPEANPEWLKEFCAGLFALAREHKVSLVGGDTTRGPLSLSIQIMGFVSEGAAITRRGARAGDRIYVTGNLGEGALGLLLLQGKISLPEEFQRSVITQLETPAPRVQASRQLRGLASACIDLSDGLLGDLGHVLEDSGVGARVRLAQLPVSPAYEAAFDQVAWQPALAGGDDYELCFTIPAEHEQALRQRAAMMGVSCTPIGEIEADPGLRLLDEAGKLYVPAFHGYDHFIKT